MEVLGAIMGYIDGQPEPKRQELLLLHERILDLAPDLKLWFLDGKDAAGKVVSNPNIGYGLRTMQYADGKTKEFYRIGLSANTTGISVYILGIEDRKFLSDMYGMTLGKASISGYCIKFRKLSDIHLETLLKAIGYGIAISA